MNDDLFDSLKKNSAQVHDKYGIISTNDGAFENLEAMDVILKNNKALYKRYKSVIQLIANNMNLYKPVIDIIGIVTFTELYAVNKVQLAKLILIETLINGIDPDDYANKNVIQDTLTTFLDETDKDNNVLSRLFASHMAAVNNQYESILTNHF